MLIVYKYSLFEWQALEKLITDIKGIYEGLTRNCLTDLLQNRKYRGYQATRFEGIFLR